MLENVNQSTFKKSGIILGSLALTAALLMVPGILNARHVDFSRINGAVGRALTFLAKPAFFAPICAVTGVAGLGSIVSLVGYAVIRMNKPKATTVAAASPTQPGGPSPIGIAGGNGGNDKPSPSIPPTTGSQTPPLPVEPPRSVVPPEAPPLAATRAVQPTVSAPTLSPEQAASRARVLEHAKAIFKEKIELNSILSFDGSPLSEESLIDAFKNMRKQNSWSFKIYSKDWNAFMQREAPSRIVKKDYQRVACQLTLERNQEETASTTIQKKFFVIDDNNRHIPISISSEEPQEGSICITQWAVKRGWITHDWGKGPDEEPNWVIETVAPLKEMVEVLIASSEIEDEIWENTYNWEELETKIEKLRTFYLNYFSCIEFISN